MQKFKTFNFDLKFCWNWSFFHYEKIMRFKNWPQLPGAGRTRAGHHHGSHTPTPVEAILLGKMAHHTKQIRRECMYIFCKPSIYFGCAHTCLSMVKYAILLIKFSLLTMNKIYGMCTKDIECFQNWLSVFKNIWMCSKYLNVLKNIWMCSKIFDCFQKY